MPYFHFCVQVNVLLVTFTMIPLSHVTRVCLATSRQTEDQGNVLRVLVECLPGLGVTLNASVSVNIYSAYMYLLYPVCVCVHAFVHACKAVGGVGGVCVCVRLCVCTYACVEYVYIDVYIYTHKCLCVHLDTCSCTSYIKYSCCTCKSIILVTLCLHVLVCSNAH